MKRMIILLLLVLLISSGCQNQTAGSSAPAIAQTADSSSEPTHIIVLREDKIPADSIKMVPEADPNPPKSLSGDYENPVPLPYPVNTAGGEDSAFILPDGQTLYFFFSPDVTVPVEQQLTDGVTGIYRSTLNGSEWSLPERVWLQTPGKLALDGCEVVLNDQLWFCSAREGYAGLHWFTADFDSETRQWQNWKLVEFPDDWEVGELHIFQDKLYFHSARPGGMGGLDIWVMTQFPDGSWQRPQNLHQINSDRDEGWPALSPDGSELWISRDYALWRSMRVDGQWTEPEKIFSPLAGEATIDQQGNVYFTHHYFVDNQMVEADIYVAYRK